MPQPSARSVALDALREWQSQRGFADAILQNLLASAALSPPDRAFAVELFYGVLRNLSLLDFWINSLRKRKLDRAVQDLLRLGLYQLFMLHTPEHAAVYETVHLAHSKQRGLINGVLRSAARRRDELQTEAAAQPLSVRASHPEFLIGRWQKNFGAEAAAGLCEWDNRPARIYGRVNLLKIDPAEFLRRYPSAQPLPNHSDFFEFERVPTDALEQGHVYIQDPSTSLACRLLDAQPGETVLDVCAAPGGKTSLIARQMRNQGTILACDRDEPRVERLRENLRRLGVQNATVVQQDWTKKIGGAFSPSLFDRILLDAPCTNTGVMRRRVDARWRLRPQDFFRMQKEQLTLARVALAYLKPNGVFVYSTCSLEPEENEEVVAALGEEFHQLELVEQSCSSPLRDGVDGAYAAKFLRRA